MMGDGIDVILWRKGESGGSVIRSAWGERGGLRARPCATSTLGKASSSATRALDTILCTEQHNCKRSQEVVIITTFSGNPNHFTILQDSQIATATGSLLPLAQTQHTDEPYFVQINSPARSTGGEEKCYDPRSCPRPEVARHQGERPRLAEGGACAPLREAWKSVATRVSVTSVGRDAHAPEIARDAHARCP